MKKQIVYYTDLDGTLLTDDKKILPSDLEQIEKFKSLGGKFAIATGRTINGARQYFDILKPNFPCIFYNGSLIYDVNAEKIIYQNCMPEVAYEMTELITKNFHDAMTEILMADSIYVVNVNECGKRQLEICEEQPLEVSFKDVPKKNWLKVLFAAEPEVIDKIIMFAYEKHMEGTDFARSGPNYFEMLPPESSKGSAIEYLFEKTSYKKDIIVTAGDYDNDIEMLKYGDISWAPSTAQKITKTYAKKVSEKSNNDGATGEVISDIIKIYF